MKNFRPIISEFKEGSIKRATIYGDEMRQFIEEVIAADPNISYQDAANTFILLKIGEIHEIFSTHVQAEILSSYKN